MRRTAVRLAMTIVMGICGTVAHGCGKAPSSYYADPDARGGPPPVWAFPNGLHCYRVGLVREVFDGCQLGVANQLERFVPGGFDDATGTFRLGYDGELGQGQVADNRGVLTSDSDRTDSDVAGCGWHQKVETTVAMIGTGAFTASIDERRTNVSPTCAMPVGDCVSTWTWGMAASDSKLPSNNCE